MESLYIKGTDFTPGIFFDTDTHVFEIGGVSRPEDVTGFYEKVFEWLSKFYEELETGQAKKEKLFLNIKLVYFNSASTKALAIIFEKFKKIKEVGINLQVDFYYDKCDEQMKEDGEDLSYTVELPFNFIMME